MKQDWKVHYCGSSLQAGECQKILHEHIPRLSERETIDAIQVRTRTTGHSSIPGGHRRPTNQQPEASRGPNVYNQAERGRADTCWPSHTRGDPPGNT